MPLKGKSVCVVNDLTIQEQRHLYATARDLKSRISRGESMEHATRASTYLMFLEDSTRTKESFRNASETMNFRTSMFDSSSSSINKFETINDTVRMLVGYTPAMESVFVIRSKIEGLCKALSESMSVYASKVGLARPIFVNAGDGRHEHPTQEFLDEFSFLEQLNNDTSRIHIALVGDLFLGRTIHSKADGLCIFDEVIVDLVAPPELQLPETYIEKMKNNGFKLNFFKSLDEYLSSGSVASILYFTRLQMERMEDDLIKNIFSLRRATSLTVNMLELLPEGAKIYHPLPRHGEFPEIPFVVDRTEFNGYDEQSRNGYFVRTALLGLLTGALVDGGEDPKETESSTSKLRVVPAPPMHPMAAPGDTWMEIEYIGPDAGEIWRRVAQFKKITRIESFPGFIRVGKTKAEFSLPLHSRSELEAQNSAFLFFAEFRPVLVTSADGELTAFKIEFSTSHRFESWYMTCPNKACVANPNTKQRDVRPAVFPSRLNPYMFSCVYCETEVKGHELFSELVPGKEAEYNYWM
jgi:aspartate carbamoyltransferase